MIPIADRHLEYAEDVKNQLKAGGFRAEVDARGERMNLKYVTLSYKKSLTCWWWAIKSWSKEQCRCGTGRW